MTRFPLSLALLGLLLAACALPSARADCCFASAVTSSFVPACNDCTAPEGGHMHVAPACVLPHASCENVLPWPKRVREGQGVSQTVTRRQPICRPPLPAGLLATCGAAACNMFGCGCSGGCRTGCQMGSTDGQPTLMCASPDALDGTCGGELRHCCTGLLSCPPSSPLLRLHLCCPATPPASVA